MDYIFTQRELKWLDDLMPEAAKKEKEDSRKLKDDDGADKEEEEKEVIKLKCSQKKKPEV